MTGPALADGAFPLVSAALAVWIAGSAPAEAQDADPVAEWNEMLRRVAEYRQ